MKIFLSWSGAKSHKIALIFRDWLPSVIQSIVPYVSSEDIDKGARWSTDIAKELGDSTFGILCVTRDNIEAPWLNFEAGALSKTMDKSLVSPFLFDIKRSEVNGPILQFQSTVFEQEDIRKLIKTLNKACEKDALPHDRLEKAFELWYPTLERELERLKEPESEAQPEEAGAALQSRDQQQILEEILDLARNNQKLLRSPEVAIGPALDEMKASVERIIEASARDAEVTALRRTRIIHPDALRELVHFAESVKDPFLGFQLALSVLRADFPWLYEIGLDTIRVLKSRRPNEKKSAAIRRFNDLLHFSLEHPLMREFGLARDARVPRRALVEMIEFALDRAMDRSPH